MSDWLALAVLLAHDVGKAGTHALRAVTTSSRARRPLLPGLAISDGYHALSGLEWLVCFAFAWGRWGAPVVFASPWWTDFPTFGGKAAWWSSWLLASSAVWVVSKRFKGRTWREAVAESWPAQLLAWRR